MADYNISLGVILETDDLQRIRSQINGIEADPIRVQLDISNVQNQINSIRTQLQNLSNIRINLTGVGFGGGGATGGIKSTVNDVNWAYRQMLDIQRKANSLSLKMNGLDTSKNVNELRELSLQFARLRSDYETLKATFGGQLNPVQFGNLQAELDETTAKLSAMDAKFADTRANLASGIQGNFGNYDAQIATLESRFSRLTNQSPDLRAGIDSVKQALDAMKIAADGGDIEGLISANERYLQVLKRVRAQLELNTISEGQDSNGLLLSQGKEQALLRLNGLFENGSAAARRFGGDVQNLKTRIEQCGTTSGLKHINKDIDILSAKVKQSGLEVQTFGSKLKAQFAQYSSYFSVYMLFMYATMAIRDMFDQVVAIDTAMTELKKVTNETSASYNQFLTNAASRAKEIGTTIDGLVSSTADFARLGYSFEDAQGLAEVANIYAVVGDEVEGVEGATESLISTMAAFKEQANGLSDSDFAMSIVDKFNEIGELIA